MNRFIYATNRSQLIYRFLIIEETETEYVVSDYDTTSYELSRVKFYIDKSNLCKARCEDKSWEFIVAEDFFASFSIDDVHNEYDKRQIEIITKAINSGEESLKELESKHQKPTKSYNNFCLNYFKLGDSVYVLLKNMVSTSVLTFLFVINLKLDISVEFPDTSYQYCTTSDYI